MSTVDQLQALDSRICRLTRGGDKPTIVQTADGYEASDTWKVPSAVFLKAMDVIAGLNEPIGTGSVFGIRYIPLRFAEAPNYCLAVRSRGEMYYGHDPAVTNPLDGSQGWFKFGLIRVDYESPRYDLEGDLAGFELSGQSGKFPVLMPPGAVSVGSGTNPVSLSWPVAGQSFTYTVHNVAAFDPADWSGSEGVLNNAAWHGYPAYHVKFGGVRYRKTKNLGGVLLWELGLPFEYREIDWRYDFDQNGTLGAVQYGGTDKFAAVDFATQFGF